MSDAEPDGCWHQWESPLHYTGHTCLEDANHDGPHICGCGDESPSI